ncbi:1469_t:CDS:10, partial [Cetraspora pellucida]
MNSISLYVLPSRRKREHSVEVEIDQLETERAKRRYVSEFLSSELTALSLHNNEEDPSVTNVQQMDIIDLDANLLRNKSPSSRKHVVMVTDLDADESEDSEGKSDVKDECSSSITNSITMPHEIRRSLKKISDNPVRALVLYQRPPWLPTEPSNSEPKGTIPRKNKEAVHERRISEIMDNGKLSPIPEDPVIDSEEMDLDLDVENNRISYDGYLGDDDEDGVEEMELTRSKMDIDDVDRTPDAEIARMFRVWKTAHQMVIDRGYVINSDAYNDIENFKESKESMMFQVQKNDNPNEQLLVVFPDDKPVGVKTLKALCQRMLDTKVSRGIVVFSGTMTAAANKAIQVINTKENRSYEIDTFSEADLMVNITHHLLVPKHYVLSEEEKKTLLNKYRLKETQLPRIQTTDPVAKYYGLKRGQ